MSLKSFLLFSLDFHEWTTWALGIAAGMLAWVFKTTVEQGKDIAAIKYYIEHRTMDAAAVLNTPNPTPQDIKVLLKKHNQRKDMTEGERQDLYEWLKMMTKSTDTAKRGAAMQMITGLETLPLMSKAKRWWWPF